MDNKDTLKNYCNNCGNYGHLYKNCRHPILSYGIILYHRCKDTEEIKIVMIERKDSLAYIEFLRGKYKSIYDTEYIELLFSRFSKEELEKIDKYDFNYSDDEINILKKLSEWPKCIDVSSSKLEPHRIPTYLYELASLFHSYWNLGKDNPKKRFINDKKKITDDKLIFLKAISNVIRSGMNIVGVSVPEKM